MWAAVYTPAFLLGVPSQAIAVLLPLYVLSLGGSPAQAAFAVALRGLGMMAMDVPAGMIAARIGEKTVMLGAVALIGASYALFATTGGVNFVLVTAFAYGAGSSSFLLGRMSYIASHCDIDRRGRVIAMIAGTLRVCALVGPFIGSAIADSWGFETAFALSAALIVVAFFSVIVWADGTHEDRRAPGFADIAAVASVQRRDLITAGSAAISFMLMRASRTVLIPLFGDHLGLSVAEIGLIVSASALIDVSLFYPAGLIMDRWGRRATAVPSSVIFALALALLAPVVGFYSLLGVALLLGIANGLSTGIVLTLGTDLAPPERRSEFLGLWRLLTDLGSTSGPLLVGGVVKMASLAVAPLVVGACGLAGAFIVWRFVEETLRPTHVRE